MFIFFGIVYFLCNIILKISVPLFLPSTCKHGNWICSLNLDCLKENVYKGYECTGYTNLHDRIACQEGYKCKFTKISEGIGSIPSLGFCEALDPRKLNVYTFHCSTLLHIFI